MSGATAQRRSVQAQRAFASDNRAIADRLRASDMPAVRELAEVYRETAARHDLCAGEIEASRDRP